MSKIDEALMYYKGGCKGPDPLDYAQECSRTLADEYIKLRDETLINESWAAKVRSELVSLNRLTDCYEQVFWSCTVWYDTDKVAYRVHGHATTRGQARGLLRVAGIECDV